MNCVIALIVAFIIGLILELRISWQWSLFTGVFLYALIFHAKRAWDDVINMIEFQAEGPFPPRRNG
jgi:hypothetical protein